MVYKGFAEKCPVLKTLKFSIISVLTTLTATLIFEGHFSKVDEQGRIFEFTLVDSELTRVDSIPFTTINVKKM